MQGDPDFDYLETDYQRTGFLVVDHGWHSPNEGDLRVRKSPELCDKCANITEQKDDLYFLVAQQVRCDQGIVGMMVQGS